MTTTETLKQMWPTQPLPLTLLLEAFYLDLKAFEVKVGFCPAAIFKFNSIAAAGVPAQDADACNLFFQKEAQLSEESKRCACGAGVRTSAFTRWGERRRLRRRRARSTTRRRTTASSA